MLKNLSAAVNLGQIAADTDDSVREIQDIIMHGLRCVALRINREKPYAQSCPRPGQALQASTSGRTRLSGTHRGTSYSRKRLLPILRGYWLYARSFHGESTSVNGVAERAGTRPVLVPQNAGNENDGQCNDLKSLLHMFSMPYRGADIAAANL